VSDKKRGVEKGFSEDCLSYSFPGKSLSPEGGTKRRKIREGDTRKVDELSGLMTKNVKEN